MKVANIHFVRCHRRSHWLTAHCTLDIKSIHYKFLGINARNKTFSRLDQLAHTTTAYPPKKLSIKRFDAFLTIRLKYYCCCGEAIGVTRSTLLVGKRTQYMMKHNSCSHTSRSKASRFAGAIGTKKCNMKSKSTQLKLIENRLRIKLNWFLFIPFLFRLLSASCFYMQINCFVCCHFICKKCLVLLFFINCNQM